ncbi:NADP-dependent oxidoreductase [Desertihabitans aurantiacus]|uniref:NADP-dependent oxidoreductase n=1 Tax=Desertihabitans aurantiacus TaxID=2282477 RepID=UPI000DF84523|nr:NADP-dependent oxidoreductase [Desertihabitans aurantiacus]
MLAARYHRFGAPDVLTVEEAPEPHAGEGAVRIRVRAVSVNPIDVLLRAGHLQGVLDLPLPLVPGRDAAGVVDEVGPGVEDVRIGDLVFGLGGISDTTGEHAVLTAWSAVPEGWSAPQAAAAGLAAATAANIVDALGDLSGRTLLVEGASGAVGRAVAAFALDAGATVIGTGRESNHAALAELGVLPTTYGDGLAERVAALAPGGVDAAVHSAPSPSLPDLVEIVGDPARVVTVIDSEGAQRLGARKVDATNDSAQLRRFADLGRRGGYTPPVEHALPLASAAEAHRLAESGSGKVVITVP